MTVARNSWVAMSNAQKTAVLTLASIEVSLTATALVDLIRRPTADIHGRKALWAVALFVQPVGPVAYLWTHRK